MDKFRFYIRLLIVFGALLAFIWLFVVVFQRVWSGNTEPLAEPFTIAITTVAGIVGGVTAIGLGVKPPPSQAGIQGRIYAFGERVLPGQSKSVQEFAIAIYTLAYILVAVMCWITWIRYPDSALDLIKDMAGVFLGMAVAVLQSFFEVD